MNKENTNEKTELMKEIKEHIEGCYCEAMSEARSAFFESIGLESCGYNHDYTGKLNMKEIGLDENTEIYIGIILDTSEEVKDVKEIKKESYEEYIKAEKEDLEKDMKVIHESFKKDKLDQL